MTLSYDSPVATNEPEVSRRRFLLTSVAGVFIVPKTGGAQTTAKAYRVGVLTSSSATAYHDFLEAFHQGLRELGWVEGRNVAFDYRFAEGKLDRLPDLAAELVRLGVDIIVASPTPPAVAAKNATGTIPIVMVNAGDPVGLGLVASLARPGGGRVPRHVEKEKWRILPVGEVHDQPAALAGGPRRNAPWARVSGKMRGRRSLSPSR
jgi:hypothetical protein